MTLVLIEPKGSQHNNDNNMETSGLTGEFTRILRSKIRQEVDVIPPEQAASFRDMINCVKPQDVHVVLVGAMPIKALLHVEFGSFNAADKANIEMIFFDFLSMISTGPKGVDDDSRDDRDHDDHGNEEVEHIVEHSCIVKLPSVLIRFDNVANAASLTQCHRVDVHDAFPLGVTIQFAVVRFEIRMEEREPQRREDVPKASTTHITHTHSHIV